MNASRLTPAMQAGTRFTYTGGMEGWVDLVDLIAPRPGVELAILCVRVEFNNLFTADHWVGTLDLVVVLELY